MSTGFSEYVQVLLPLRLEWEPWYRTDRELKRGDRVEVMFCGKKYFGVVVRICDRSGIDAASVQDIAGYPPLPRISDCELRLWKFTADYYLCTQGEVYKAAYPFRKVQAEMSRRSVPAPQASPEPCGKKSGKPTLLIAPPASRMERYADALHRCLDSGRSALVLVPEISLATNMEELLRLEFPDSLQVHHSLKTPVQRRKVCEALRDTSRQEVILGTRASLFLPYRNLGLVIVDEEQDVFYKQEEPAPRYNARDLALVLASLHGADAILGSACPSLESLYNAWNGKYSLDAEAAPVLRPAIVDIPSEKRKMGMDGPFSFKAVQAIGKAKGEVAVIRGWEPPECVQEAVEKLFPGKPVDILSIREARISNKRYSLAVYLQADALFPKEDFRSDEKAIQNITRTALIADEVMVQTSKSTHPVYQALKRGEGIHEALLDERRAFRLPPFSRLVRISDSNTMRLGALQRKLGPDARITKPSPDSILIQLPRDSSLGNAKSALVRALNGANAEIRRGGTQTVDIDPV